MTGTSNTINPGNPYTASEEWQHAYECGFRAGVEQASYVPEDTTHGTQGFYFKDDFIISGLQLSLIMNALQGMHVTLEENGIEYDDKRVWGMIRMLVSNQRKCNECP